MKRSTWCCLSFVIACLLPLPAAGQSIRVTLLGTGTPRPDGARMGPATLVEAGSERLLIDVGRGTTIRLGEAGVDSSSITSVLLTHFHSDHVVGLADLWLLGHVSAWFRDRPLEVHGPPGVIQLADGLTRAFSRDRELRSNPRRPGPALEAREFTDAGVVFERNGVRVTAFAVDHVPDSYGYRIDFGGRAVVISGDARPSESLLKAAAGADLLVLELMAIDEKFLKSRPEQMQQTMRAVLATHTTPMQAGEMLSRARPRLGVFNHVSLAGINEEQAMAEVRTLYDGKVEMGVDLMTLVVGAEITVERRAR